MNYRYFWKELLPDGSLKEPTYYDDSHSLRCRPFNFDDGFKTEQDAVEQFQRIDNSCVVCACDLVLIKVYSTFRFD